MQDRYYKYIVWVLVAVLLILLIRGCGKGNTGFFSCNGNDTVSVKRDTVIAYIKGDTVYVPEPEFVGVTNTIHVPVLVHDTLEMDGETIVKIQHDDTAAILHDYYITRYYSDTQNLARGRVIIQDSVTENRITRRRLKTFGTDTTINTIITLRQPKKLIVYFTTSLTGNLHDPVDGIGTGIALKGKNDVIIGGEVKFQTDKRPMYEGRIMLPLRLTKRR
jgi:hypothetical protein